jgi:hypothetical protein
MTTFFIPYHDDQPVTVEIKGHRLIIVSPQLREAEESLAELGANEIRTLKVTGDGSEALAQLAATVNGGVLITPPGISVSTMITNLERELPWIH